MYLVVFFISMLILNFGLKQKNRKVGFAIEILALLIPCLLAGFRAVNIGTDTKGYPLKLYNYAGSGVSFKELVSFSDLWYLSVDYLYLAITYIFGHFHLSFQFYLFILEMLVIVPYYFSLKNELKDKNSIIFGMFLFFFTFYNLSLNMIRQSISISFALLSFSIFKNEQINISKVKRIIISFGVLFVGYLFHDTIVIMLPFYAVYSFFKNKKINIKSKKIVSCTIVLLMFLLLILYKPVLQFISSLGIYNKINYYINTYTRFDIDYTGTLLNFLIVLLIYWGKKDIDNSNDDYLFASTISWCNMIMFFFGTFIKYTYRIAYYLFYMLLSFYIPILFNKNLENNRKKQYLRIAIILIFIVYWSFVILIKNSNETIPYRFFFW